MDAPEHPHQKSTVEKDIISKAISIKVAVILLVVVLLVVVSIINVVIGLVGFSDLTELLDIAIDQAQQSRTTAVATATKSALQLADSNLNSVVANAVYGTTEYFRSRETLLHSFGLLSGFYKWNLNTLPGMLDTMRYFHYAVAPVYPAGLLPSCMIKTSRGYNGLQLATVHSPLNTMIWPHYFTTNSSYVGWMNVRHQIAHMQPTGPLPLPVTALGKAQFANMTNITGWYWSTYMFDKDMNLVPGTDCMPLSDFGFTKNCYGIAADVPPSVLPTDPYYLPFDFFLAYQKASLSYPVANYTTGVDNEGFLELTIITDTISDTLAMVAANSTLTNLRIYLTHLNGDLIAATAGSYKLIQMPILAATFLPSQSSDDPVVATTASYIAANSSFDLPTGSRLKFSVLVTDANGTENYLVVANSFQTLNLRMLVVVAIPERSIMGSISEDNLALQKHLLNEGLKLYDEKSDRVFQWSCMMSVISTAVALFALGVAIYFSIVITSPIRLLVHRMQRVAKLDMEEEEQYDHEDDDKSEIDDAEYLKAHDKCHSRHGGADSRLMEISDLQRSFNVMRRSLTSFAKYLPAEVCMMYVGSDKPARLGMTPKPAVTVMFSDIEGFTSICEAVKIQRLIQVVDEYFTKVTDCIHAAHGSIDKYIGDAVMATWGAVDDTDEPTGVMRACYAALMMQLTIKRERKKWAQKLNGRTMATRIGLHCGKALVGNVGSRDRFNYTCIGDVVNLASRLEGANKAYGTNILLSEAVHQYTTERFVSRLLGVIRVKGKRKPTKIFELWSSSVKAEGSEVLHRSDSISSSQPESHLSSRSLLPDTTSPTNGVVRPFNSVTPKNTSLFTSAAPVKPVKRTYQVDVKSAPLERSIDVNLPGIVMTPSTRAVRTAIMNGLFINSTTANAMNQSIHSVALPSPGASSRRPSITSSIAGGGRRSSGSASVADKRMLAVSEIMQQVMSNKMAAGDDAANDIGCTVETEEKIAMYSAAVQLYLDRRFASALPRFEDYQRWSPKDKACNDMIEMCKDMIQNPPDPEWWDGVVSLKEK